MRSRLVESHQSPLDHEFGGRREAAARKFFLRRGCRDLTGRPRFPYDCALTAAVPAGRRFRFCRLASGRRAGDPGEWSRERDSALLPTYARADLAFERGEGAWLTATNGERYLDFGGGIAVDCARLLASASCRGAGAPGGQALAHVQSVPDPAGRAARAAPRRRDLRRSACSSPIRAPKPVEAAIKMARKYQYVERPSRALSASSPSKAPSTAARWRPSPPAASQISRRLRPQGRRLRPGPLQRSRRGRGGDRPAIPARILIEPIQGEGGVRVGSAWLPARPARALRRARTAAGLRRSADAASAAPASFFAYEHVGRRARHHGARQGHRRRLSARRLPCDGRGRQGHDASARMARPSAAIRWRWRRQRRARRRAGARLPRACRAARACCCASASPSCEDRHPAIIEEIRGEGLMLGMKLQRSQHRLRRRGARGETADRSRPGDNVVRLLPPLIIGEEEIAEGVRRLDAACARLRERDGAAAHGRRRMSGTHNGAPRRHFLDLSEVPADDAAPHPRPRPPR